MVFFYQFVFAALHLTTCGLESNARRYDNLGFNMPLAMVQADLHRKHRCSLRFHRIPTLRALDPVPEQE